MRPLDPFYPVVDSADWVRRMLGAGARLVQLRIKDKPADLVRAEIRTALDLCAATGADPALLQLRTLQAVEAGGATVVLTHGGGVELPPAAGARAVPPGAS